MKPKVNPERRKFFTKFGIGALSAGVLRSLPFKLFAAAGAVKENSEQRISITINPMAVKRTRKN